LVDEADGSILIQFVKARRGVDAANYALRFDESGEGREDGYKVLSALSSDDFENLKSELDNFGGKAVNAMQTSKDVTTVLRAFISD